MPKTIEDLTRSREIRAAVLHEFGGDHPPDSILINDRSDRALDLMVDVRSYSSTGWTPESDVTMSDGARTAFSISGQSCRGKDGALSRFPQNIGRILLHLYTKPGDVVVDPFAGHNSRMELCWRSNRHYVGHDISREFMEANRRIREILEEEKRTDLFPENFTGSIILHECDSRKMPISDATGDFTITSPPYWDLEDYGDEPEQLGKRSYEEFLQELGVVAQENYRCLRPGSFCCWCVNDFRKGGKFYLYHIDTIALMRAAGFVPHDIAIMDLGQPIGAAFASQIVDSKVLPKRHEYAIIMRRPEIDGSVRKRYDTSASLIAPPSEQDEFPW